MKDTIDRACELEQLQRAFYLARQQEKSNLAPVSAFECEECGEAIPEARRQALIGVRCCIECQEEIEHYGKTSFSA